MPDLKWNEITWDGSYDWSSRGEEWSQGWGSSEAQWFGAVYPRIHRLLPADNILEIATGFGRWTKFLIPHAKKFVGVDLSSECVEACRTSFIEAKHATFFQNDGLSLEIVPSSLDFIFSFDSLVHVEDDVLAGYIGQIIEKLSPDGIAFIHHSNFATMLPGVENPHRRAESVSGIAVASVVAQHGGRVLLQEMVNWGCEQLIDCFTIFSRGAAKKFPVIYNQGFMAEAANIKRAQAPYGILPNRANRSVLRISNPIEPLAASMIFPDPTVSESA
jgi:2-polyprenyl-3-methyl-5-hydroxy-6-metoxy-1,4-benzoquinol methylase